MLGGGGVFAGTRSTMPQPSTRVENTARPALCTLHPATLAPLLPDPQDPVRAPDPGSQRPECPSPTL